MFSSLFFLFSQARHGSYYHELHSEDMNQIDFSYVPECLLSSLEYVDFNVPISGHAAETKLLEYFLENSAVLKKLTIRLGNHSIKENSTLNKLRIPRGSSKCGVVVLSDR